MKTEGNKIVVSHINIRESISILLFRLIALDVLGALIISIFFGMVCQAFPGASVSEWLLSYNVLFFIFLGSLKIALTTFIILQWLNEYYELTPTEVIHKKGVLFNDAQRYKLEYVRTIQFHQGILGRMFNFGSISLQDIRRREFLQLYLIHNPHRYKHILEKLIVNPHEEAHELRPHLFGEDDVEESTDEEDERKRNPEDNVEEKELGPHSVR